MNSVPAYKNKKYTPDPGKFSIPPGKSGLLLIITLCLCFSSCNRKNIWDNEYLKNTAVYHYIYTVQDLDAVHGTSALPEYAGWGLDDSYYLMADLDLSGYGNWDPIGNNAPGRFTGTFKGNSHTITNLTINSAADYKGLFGYIDSAGNISDLILTNINITGGNNTGGIAGTNAGTINACRVSGVIASSGSYIGGLAGDNSGPVNGSNSNCTITVTGNNNMYIGGLAGNNTADITNSYAVGDVNVTSEVNYSGTGEFQSSIGGLLGYNSANITGSYATGNIDVTFTVTSSTQDVIVCAGGLVGFSQTAGVVYISGSYTTGAVDVSMTAGTAIVETLCVGGLIGANYGPVISDCSHNTGVVSVFADLANYVAAGGLFGYNIDAPVTACNAASNVDVTANGLGNDFEVYTGGLVGFNLYDAVLGSVINCHQTTGTVDVSGVTNFDVVCTGGLIGFNMQPIVNSDATGAVIGTTGIDTTASGGLVGYNGADISNSHATGAVSGVTNTGGLSGYNLADITDSYATGAVSGVDNTGGLVGEGGNTATINNCYHDTGTVSGTNYTGGLIGYNSGTVTNSCKLSGSVNGSGSTGGFAGVNIGTLENCYVTINVNGTASVGGFVGENGVTTPVAISGTITYCYATGVVSATGVNCGGLVGINRNGTVSLSFTTTGTVNGGTSAVGGLVGRNMASGVIENCYSRCDVYGNDYAGGLVGYIQTGSSISYCYATGLIDQTAVTFGGFSATNAGTLTACYYDGDTTGYYGNPGAFIPAALPATTIQMTSDALASPNNNIYYNTGWDFYDESTNGSDDYWTIDGVSNAGYPFFTP